jgi:hypothetical protein
MLIEKNEVYNTDAFLNGHQGRNWVIRGNYIHDTYWGIGVEEHVANVVIEDNLIACLGDYNTNINGTAAKCTAAITVNDGDNPPSDGCADDCTGYSGCLGRCTARDIVIRRNRMFGLSYGGEPGMGRGVLIGGIAFFAHNSAGDLGNTRVENNMIWNVQQGDDCNLSNFYGNAPNDTRESGIGIYTSDPVTVQNNTVYDSACWGLMIGGGGRHVVRGNLFVEARRKLDGADFPELMIVSNSSSSDIQYNNMYTSSVSAPVVRYCDTNNVCSTSYNCSQVSTFGIGNKCSATLFANVSDADRRRWDLHLGVGDLVNLDAGGGSGSPEDIDRQARAAPFDIGADEKGSQDSQAPAPPTGVAVAN